MNIRKYIVAGCDLGVEIDLTQTGVGQVRLRVPGGVIAFRLQDTGELSLNADGPRLLIEPRAANAVDVSLMGGP